MRRGWWWCGALLACGGGQADDTDAADDSDDSDALVEDTDLLADDTDEPVETDDGLPDDPCVTQQPVIRVGTGEAAFESLTAGQVVEMVHGAQGGWHVTAALSAQYSPQFVRYQLVVTDVATGVVLSLDRVPLEANIGLVPPVLGQPWACAGFYANIEGRLDFRGVDDDEVVVVWEELCGRRVRLDMSLRTPAGELLGSDSVEIILQPDPEDGGHCALR